MKAGKEITRFALYALVIVLLNIALQTVFFRVDLTSNRGYSLTQVSKEMVQNLEEPLTVKIYISANLPYPYNNLEQNLRDTLEEYAISGNRNFNYYIYTINNLDEEMTDESKEYEEDAKGYGIRPIQIQRVEQNEIGLTSAYMGAAFVHADMVETVPVINPSENIEYMITSTVTNMQEKTSRLLSLEENISVKLYLSSSLFELSDDLRTYPEKLSAVVDSLNRINYNRIDFEWIDADRDQSAVSASQEFGFSPLNLQNEDGSVQETYASAVIDFGAEYSSFDVITRGIFGYSIQDPGELENDINDVIEQLIGVGRKVGWLSDHNTVQMYGGGQQYGEPSVSAFVSQVSGRYNLEQVTLGSSSMPDGLGSLIIVRPQPFSEFTDWELYQIDQFIMKGGNVAIFMDSFMEYIPQNNGQQGQPIYIPRNTGLEKLLEHYGVGIGKSYVLDENCFKQQQQSETGIMEIPIYFAPKLDKKQINTDLPYLDGLPGLVMLNASPIEVQSDLPEGRTVSVLFSSSEKSWLADDPQNINLYNPMMIMPPPGDEGKQSYPLAAVIEGSLTSYFADRGVPERPEPETSEEDAAGEAGDKLDIGNIDREESIVKSTDHGRVFVFGSSMAITDSLVDAQGASSNAIMLFNILDEMNGRGDFSTMRKKGLIYSPIGDVPAAVKTFIKTFNIAVIPVLVIIAGLIVLLRWSSRRKKIAAAFMEDKNGQA